MHFLSRLVILIILWALAQSVVVTLPSAVRCGSFLSGSPLGKVLSRLIYSRSQIDWHYGVQEYSCVSDHGSWIERLIESTRPPHQVAHQVAGGSCDKGRNWIVIQMMQWALDCDPAYGRVYLEKAFLESGFLHDPLLAEQTLERGLSQVNVASERLALLVDLFQLRWSDLHNRPKAQALATTLSATLNQAVSASPRASLSLQSEARACLHLVNSTVVSKAATGSYRE